VGKRVIVVDLSVGEDADQLHVLVNPEIVAKDGEAVSEEGCLSVPRSAKRSPGPTGSRSGASTSRAGPSRSRGKTSRPGLLPRDRPSRRHPLRREALGPEAGPHQEEVQEERGGRQESMRIVFFGSPAAALPRSKPSSARDIPSDSSSPSRTNPPAAAAGSSRRQSRRSRRPGHPGHRAGEDPRGRGRPGADRRGRARRQRRRRLRPDHPPGRPLFPSPPFPERPLLPAAEIPGAAPVQWTVLNGDAGSGVTVIELNDRMDEGDILAQERVAVGPRETARALENRLAALGAALLVRTLARLDEIVPVPQDDAKASLAPRSAKRTGGSPGLILPPASTGGSSLWQTVRASSHRSGQESEYFRRTGGRSSGAPGAGEAARRGRSSGSASPASKSPAARRRPTHRGAPAGGRGAMSAYAFSLGTKLAPAIVWIDEDFL